MKKAVAIILALVICLGLGITAFAANKYTVIFNPNGGKVDTLTKEVTVGEKLGELPTPKREGYVFEGWTLNGSKVTKDTVYSNEGDTVYTAKWKNAKGYTLTLDATGGKCVERSRFVDFNSGIGELPEPTRTGYKFVGWHEADGTIVIERTRFEKNTTVYAKWVKTDVKGTVEEKFCDHDFDKDGKCKDCGIVITLSDGSHPTNEGESNPNTGAPAAVSAFAAVAVIGAAALYLGKKK